MSKTKKILITGAAGYIGSACTTRLLERGHQVTALDNLSHGDKKYIDARAKFVNIDLREKKDLASLFTKNLFDVVLHFAALKNVAEGETRVMDYFENNIGGTLNLLSQMSSAGVKTIIFSSSAAVYDFSQQLNACTEDTPVNPGNVYGDTKLIGEMMIMSSLQRKILERAVLFRYFNVAGDAGLCFTDPLPQNVFQILAQAVNNKSSFQIFGNDYATRDGTCVRDYVHLLDLIDAHVSAVESSTVSGIFNLGTAKGYTVKELVNVFGLVSGGKIDIQIAPRRVGDSSVALADSSKAMRDFGWSPKYTLEDMVRSTLGIYATKNNG